MNCTKEECPTSCPKPGENTNNAHPCCKNCPEDASFTSTADQQASNSADDSRFLGSGTSSNQMNSPKLNLGTTTGNGNGFGRSTGNGDSSPFAILGGILDSEEEMDEDDEDGIGAENSEFVSCFHQGKITFGHRMSCFKVYAMDEMVQENWLVFLLFQEKFIVTVIRLPPTLLAYQSHRQISVCSVSVR